MITKRTSTFLMANLGSEISRLFNLRRQGRGEDALESAKRAISIAEEIMSRPENSGAAREAGILKEVIKDAVSLSPKYSINSHDLNSYFLPISLRLLSIK